jgi:hypothetical protein
MPLNKPAVFFSQRLNNKFFRDYPHPLPALRRGTVLECGAFDGKTDSVGWWFEYNLGWTSYNIEHDPQSFMFCEMSRSNATNIEATLSSEPGDGKITYKDFIEEYGVELIDLFVLAVGGNELDVVAGMQGAEVWPRIICAETNNTSAEDLAVALGNYEIKGRDKMNTYYERRN